MIDFRQKRKVRTILSSHYTHAVLFVVFIFLAMSALERYQIAEEMESRRVAAEEEAAALEVRRAQIDAQVKYLSDDRGVEAELRRQFDVSRDGEQVVVIVEPEPTVAIEPLSTTTVEKRAWYEFWR